MIAKTDFQSVDDYVASQARGLAGCTAREVPMCYGQRVQLQERATRTAVDSFNEVFNRHDVNTSAAL
jgi:hypothetical protein